MVKIVINKCHGGFSLSDKAVKLYGKMKGLNLKKKKDEYGRKDYYINGEDFFSDIDIERDDPILIDVILQLGEEANGSCAKLKIVEIPDDVEYDIKEYDGLEWIAEKHRTWG
jgi:hypothetical protein